MNAPGPTGVPAAAPASKAAPMARRRAALWVAVAGVVALLLGMVVGWGLAAWKHGAAPAPASGRASAPPAAAASAVSLKAGVFEPARPAPAFRLVASDGGEATLERFRGQVVLMSFGFTNCAAVCPVTLATLAEARKALGADARAVQVLFVSVDPERDGVERMRSYVAAFDPSFLGVTGTPEALAAMRTAYGVTANRHVTGDTYVMDHTSSVFLIDRDGQLRALMPYGQDPADYVHDVKRLLAP